MKKKLKTSYIVGMWTWRSLHRRVSLLSPLLSFLLLTQAAHENNKFMPIDVAWTKSVVAATYFGVEGTMLPQYLYILYLLIIFYWFKVTASRDSNYK